MKLYNMGDRPLAFDVRCGKKVVIPKGATNVKIGFRQSPFTYTDENGKRQHLNVYIYQNKMYHA